MSSPGSGPSLYHMWLKSIKGTEKVFVKGSSISDAMPRISLSLFALAQIARVSGWTWPSPQLERLDALRFDQVGPGTINNILTRDTSPCDQANDANAGHRTRASDWIRTVCSFSTLISSFHLLALRLTMIWRPSTSQMELVVWMLPFNSTWNKVVLRLVRVMINGSPY
jgi:hypothetical protein